MKPAPMRVLEVKELMDCCTGLVCLYVRSHKEWAGSIGVGDFNLREVTSCQTPF